MFDPADDIRANSNLADFLKHCDADQYEKLVDQSNTDPDWFWSQIIDLAGIRLSNPYRTLRDISDGPENNRWAEAATLNLTETCLDSRIDLGAGDKTVIDWVAEDGSTRSWTYRELAQQSARLSDSDARAVLTVDATPRRGRAVPMEQTLVSAIADLPLVRTVFSLRRFGGTSANPARDLDWHETMDAANPTFPANPVDAADPLMIAYTSGTTGNPKGVVHSHLGVQAKATADFLLCLDLRRDDRHLWMTDMNWVMGPLTLISVLLAGATLVLAEGAPSTPDDPFQLLRIAAEKRVTHMGIAPTLVRQFMAQDPAPLAGYDLSLLRIVGSTGEPWTDNASLWQLAHICRNRAAPLNISGGTELFGAILTSTVLHRLKPGGFSAQALGVGAKVLRPDGSKAAMGEVGELVVTQPPMGLTPTIWQDKARYLETYWSTFPGVWSHGDWVHHDPDGTWHILDRSDDTLNIAGKRIGPPEIEAAMTRTDRVVDAAAIAGPDDLKGIAVVVVSVAAPGITPDAALVEFLKDAVGETVSKPFRPREIHFVRALPKTRTTKTVRHIAWPAFLGEDPGDLSSVQNPETIAPIAALQGTRT